MISSPLRSCPVALVLALVGASFPLHAKSVTDSRARNEPIVGSYSDQQLATIKSFTLPRLFLYDESGRLVPQDHWPAALRDVKAHAGDGFCCVSDKPAPSGSTGPPPDCKRIYYGKDVRSNFAGLRDASGHQIGYDSLPAHKYLLVDYHADWCQPCVEGRSALETFFRSSAAQGYVWVLIDMTRLADLPENGSERKGTHH